MPPEPDAATLYANVQLPILKEATIQQFGPRYQLRASRSITTHL